MSAKFSRFSLATLVYRCILGLSVRREKGTNMLYALLSDPLNTAINFGDVIAFLAFCAALLIALKSGARNGR